MAQKKLMRKYHTFFFTFFLEFHIYEKMTKITLILIIILTYSLLLLSFDSFCCVVSVEIGVVVVAVVDVGAEGEVEGPADVEEVL